MIIENYASYLYRAGVGVIGETLFVHQMPSEVISGILLTTAQGGIQFDNELKGYYKDIFRLVVHSDSLSDGVSLVDAVLSRCEIEDTQVGDICFNYVRPINYPEPYRQEGTGRFEFVMVMEFSCFKTL